MALPINSTKSNQEGCTPLSSNCVIWQGSDIPCIDLCKGDSISDVTFKLATELCTVLEQLDVNAYDLTCFNPVCPSLEDFKALIQFLINKICICCPDVPVPDPVTGCPDCLVNIASCFYYQNEFGDTITQMQLTDYARAIGTKVYTITGQINTINTTLTSLQNQIDTLTGRVTDTNSRIPDSGSSSLFSSSCLYPSIPVEGIPLPDFTSALETAFCQLRAATGMPSALLNSILQQCVLLDTSESLNLPGVNMGSLPGWITSGSYSTVADSINNMWITMCDMRAAVRTILNTCCPQGCEGLVINLQTTLTGSTINFFWTGDVTGFEDCNPAGSLVTVTDAYGNTYTTRIPIVAYVNGTYALNLSGSPINTGTNLSIHFDACFEKISDGSTCERCIETVIINQSACPALTLSADTGSVIYGFTNNISGAVQYDVILKLFSDGSTVDTHTIVLGAPGPVSGVFNSGILPGTMYSLTIQITIGGIVTNVCPTGIVSTQPLTCNPPTEVSAITSFS